MPQSVRDEHSADRGSIRTADPSLPDRTVLRPSFAIEVKGDGRVTSNSDSTSGSFVGWGIGGNKAPFMDVLGARPIRKEHGEVAFELTVEEKHLRTLGIVHGGVTAAMLDCALGFAAGTTAPEGHHVVTVQLSLNYIRPAWKGEKLVATGEVRHAGKQTAVSRGELRTAEGILVASGTGTFMYLPIPAGVDHKMEKHAETERIPTTP